MTDLSDTAATLARWQSRGGKWGATLVRNGAGAYLILETKDGRPCGTMTRPRGYFADDATALQWARAAVPASFNVRMVEQ